MTALILLMCPGIQADQPLLTIGAYQRQAGPRCSHVWAVLEYRGLRHCISWGPAGEWQPGVQAGRNRDEVETLEWARRVGARVWLWGPYPVEDGLARRFLERKQALESGKYCYVFLDGRRHPHAMNCITAILVDGSSRPRAAWGWKAGVLAARRLVQER